MPARQDMNENEPRSECQDNLNKNKGAPHKNSVELQVGDPYPPKAGRKNMQIAYVK